MDSNEMSLEAIQNEIKTLYPVIHRSLRCSPIVLPSHDVGLNIKNLKQRDGQTIRELGIYLNLLESQLAKLPTDR